MIVNRLEARLTNEQNYNKDTPLANLFFVHLFLPVVIFQVLIEMLKVETRGIEPAGGRRQWMEAEDGCTSTDATA